MIILERAHSVDQMRRYFIIKYELAFMSPVIAIPAILTEVKGSLRGRAPAGQALSQYVVPCVFYACRFANFVYGQIQLCCCFSCFIMKPGCHIVIISANRLGCLKPQRSVLLEGIDVQLERS